MKNVKRNSLIKREETLKDFLGVVLRKMTFRSKSYRQLVIPKISKSDTDVTFLSLIEKMETNSNGDSISTAKELLEIISSNKITGNGGASFPTDVKVKAFADATEQKVLIVNAVECDPGLVQDKWILKNKIDQVVESAKLLKNILKISEVIIASKEIVSINDDSIKCVQVPDYYPAGAEKILIKNVIGTDYGCETIPAKQGVLVLNIQTVLSIYNAINFPDQMRSQYLTFCNTSTSKSVVVEAEIGTPISKIVEQVGAKDGSLFVGGGIMQTRPLANDDKVNSGINFIAIGEGLSLTEQGCVGCDQCIAFCPSRIDAKEAAKYYKDAAKKSFEGEELKKCIECGSCSYVCPKNIDLCNYIISGKELLQN